MNDRKEKDMTLEDLRKTDAFKAAKRSIIKKCLLVFGGILVFGAAACLWVMKGNLGILIPFAAIGAVLAGFIASSLDEMTLSLLHSDWSRSKWSNELEKHDNSTDPGEH